MADSDRAALEHIRKVAETTLSAAPDSSTPAAATGAALLPVPYVSQFGAGADRYNNDSAAAAGAMLVRAYTGQAVTPDEFFGRSGQTADRSLALQQMSAALIQYGLLNDVRSGLKLADLFAAITTARPVVMTVRQNALRDAGLTVESYSGVHYLVAVGLDVENVYVNDPFRHDNSGQGQAVPIPVLYRAWTQLGKEQNTASLERAAIIPRVALRRRVTPTTTVNVRGGPATTYAIVGQVGTGEVLEVTQIHGDWGRMGDQRWIALTYTKDI